MTSSVVFKGRIRAGVGRAEAQANLARLFKIADASRLDRYFSGDEIVIKAGLDAAQAQKYLQALEQAGLMAFVRDDAAPDALMDLPPPPRPATPRADSNAFRADPAAFEAPAASPPPRPSAPPAPIAPAAKPTSRATFEVPVAPEPPPTPALAPVRMWWVVKPDKSRLGPYAREEINAMAQHGEVTMADGIWKAGLKTPLAPSTLSWISMPDPVVAELLGAQAAAAQNPAMSGMPPLNPPPPVPGNISAPPPAAADDYFQATDVSAFMKSASGAPRLSAAVVIFLVLVLGINVLLAYAQPVPGDSAYRIGHVFGAVLVIPFFVMLICAIWESNRNISSQSKAMLFASLFVTCSLLIQTGHGLNSGALLDAQLSIGVKALNNGLPRMVDKETRLDRVDLNGHEVTYNYTLVHMTADNKPQVDNISDQIRSTLTQKNCADVITVKRLQQGVTYHHIYRGSDQSTLMEFQLGLPDCPGQGAAAPGSTPSAIPSSTPA